MESSVPPSTPDPLPASGVRPDRLGRWSRGAILATTGLLAATIIRVAQLETVPSAALSRHLDPRTTTATRPAERGRVLDRRGQVVAMSVLTRRLFADPAFLYEQSWAPQRRAAERGTAASEPPPDPFADAAKALAAAIGADAADLEQRLRDRADSRYVVLLPEIEEWQADAVAVLDIPGLGIETRLKRIQPFGSVGAGLVGRVGWTGEGKDSREHSGQSGAEARFEKDLLHQDGRVTYLRDARGRSLRVSEGDYAPPQDGEDVRLSIDMVVQEIAERNLLEAVKKSNAGGGQVIVVDLVDGSILAVADVLRTRPGWREPSRDPQRELDPALGRPRSVTDPYEPGSTFKPFVWAYATDLGLVRPEEVLPTPSGEAMVLRNGRSARAIRDVKYYGPSSWRKVLIKSLNTGMALVSQRMTARQMQECLRAFGFGESTSCGLPGESAGLVTSPKDWKMLYTQVSVSFGQEIGTTAMQMIRAFAALCGDGTLPTLRLTVPEEGDLISSGRRAVSARTARLAREVMEEVMLDGTGRKAQSERYRIFGKSGTAQLPKPDGGGYFEDRYRSSFIGGAPFEQPRLAVLCVIDDPDRRAVPNAYGGGALAGPVVRDIMDEALVYLGVPPDKMVEAEPSDLVASGATIRP